MEARSLVSHQHSWWFFHFSLREKLAGSHNQRKTPAGGLAFSGDYEKYLGLTIVYLIQVSITSVSRLILKTATICERVHIGTSKTIRLSHLSLQSKMCALFIILPI